MSMKEDFLKMVDTKEFELDDIQGLIPLLLFRNKLVHITRYAKDRELESLLIRFEHINKQIREYLNL